MLAIPSYMPHYCGKASRILEPRRNNAASPIQTVMQERQQPIAEWMRDVIKRRGISARVWAESAKLGKDTVSRALRDDYPHVTTTTTIAKLADAISERAPGAAGGLPSAPSLAAILRALLEAVQGEGRVSDDVVWGLAEGLRDTLLHLADEPEALDDPKMSHALARASVRQLRQRRV